MNYKPKVIDLFCGGGGFSTGFQRCGFEILAGVDIDEDSLDTFRNNHNAPGYKIDLSETEPNKLLDTIEVDADEFDGIIGGPPCQGFSQAGNRDPNDDRNKLVKNYFNIIEELNPDFFVMENVRAITYDRNKHIIEYIEDRLNQMEYDYTYDVLNAANYGVPQTRKRLFILGISDNKPKLPDKTHRKEEWVGVNDVIDVPDGQIVSSYGTQETLRGERNTRNTDQPSYTLRATRCLIDIIPNDYEPPEDDDIPSISDVRIYRFDEDDAMRVQSFPDDYSFEGNLTSQRSQIGNAVPPNVSENIAKSVMDTLYDQS